jgi:hypothetical protein
VIQELGYTIIRSKGRCTKPGGVDLQNVGMRLQHHITEGQVSTHTAHAAHTAQTQHTHGTHTAHTAHTQHTHSTHTHTLRMMLTGRLEARRRCLTKVPTIVSALTSSPEPAAACSATMETGTYKHTRDMHTTTQTHTHSDVEMGKLSVIQSKPDRFVFSQWPHLDGRRAAGRVRHDHLDCLRGIEGAGSLMVADSDGCGVKFDSGKVILNRGDMLFWLPWVRHCGKSFLTWLFAG